MSALLNRRGRKVGGYRRFDQGSELLETIVDAQTARLAPCEVDLGYEAGQSVDGFRGVGVEDRWLYLACERSKPHAAASALIAG
jgi:hypothetical protein